MSHVKILFLQQNFSTFNFLVLTGESATSDIKQDIRPQLRRNFAQSRDVLDYERNYCAEFQLLDDL